MEKDKKYNVVLGLMIFFFLVIVGVSIAWGLGYIGINKNSINENYEANNGTIENGQANIQNQVSNNTTTNSQTKVEEQASNKQTTSKTVSNVSVLNLDSSKCLDKDDDTSKYEYMINDYFGTYVYYDQNKLYIGISENGELYQSSGDIIVECDKGYEIKNINVSEISEVIVEGWGNGIDFPVVFFLMVDGTVEWLDTQSAFTKKDFSAEGKVEGVENIVKIVKAGVSGEYDGGYTVLGVKQDGSFYDLINKTVNK